MIRTLLAVDGRLVRGSLAFVLSAQPDIEVVGEIDDPAAVAAAVRARRPDVTVVDLDLIHPHDLPEACAGEETPDWCRALVLIEPRRAARLSDQMARHTPRLGFLSKHANPQRVVEAVRDLARGEVVMDADLVAAALDRSNPLTVRENEILEIAAAGRSVGEIAERLSLAPGTVRNHLSRILTKAGARNRVDAVRIARESGWI